MYQPFEGLTLNNLERIALAEIDAVLAEQMSFLHEKMRFAYSTSDFAVAYRELVEEHLIQFAAKATVSSYSPYYSSGRMARFLKINRNTARKLLWKYANREWAKGRLNPLRSKDKSNDS